MSDPRTIHERNADTALGQLMQIAIALRANTEQARQHRAQLVARMRWAIDLYESSIKAAEESESK